MLKVTLSALLLLGTANIAFAGQDKKAGEDCSADAECKAPGKCEGSPKKCVAPPPPK